MKPRQEIKRRTRAAAQVRPGQVMSSAKELGIEALCEGVETEEQYQFARAAKIDYIQGFYFYRPLAGGSSFYSVGFSAL